MLKMLMKVVDDHRDVGGLINLLPELDKIEHRIREIDEDELNIKEIEE